MAGTADTSLWRLRALGQKSADGGDGSRISTGARCPTNMYVSVEFGGEKAATDGASRASAADVSLGGSDDSENVPPPSFSTGHATGPA
jgi:hypothetical protein